MATTLGGVTLAEPAYENEGYVRVAEDVGAIHGLADGDVVYDYVGTRYRFRLNWKTITEAERNTILTRYLVKTAQAFSPPDAAGTYTVLVVPGSFRDGYIEDGSATRRYNCELELVETTV